MMHISTSLKTTRYFSCTPVLLYSCTPVFLYSCIRCTHLPRLIPAQCLGMLKCSNMYLPNELECFDNCSDLNCSHPPLVSLDPAKYLMNSLSDALLTFRGIQKPQFFYSEYYPAQEIKQIQSAFNLLLTHHMTISPGSERFRLFNVRLTHQILFMS